MCALCGDLTPRDHWSEQGPGATGRRPQQQRLQGLRRLLEGTGLTVTEWQGRGYQLANGRGRTVLVRDLGALWAEAEAERMRGRPVDPLAARSISLARVNPAAVVTVGPVDLTHLPDRVAATEVPPLPPEQHLTGVTSASALLPGPVDWAAFAVWISALLHAHGDRVLRLKAVLDTGSGTPVVLDAVQHVVHPPRHLPAWTGPPTSSLVVISRDLPADHVVAALRDFLHQPGRAPGARGPSPTA
ncbi:MAG: GTP-binding protein [Actinomycetota bacterium]|nr:GTP-binding protein [Actinomycetota bacterium]